MRRTGRASYGRSSRPARTPANCFQNGPLAYAEECCRGALVAAGVTVDDIDLFVFFSTTAWQSQFTAQVLGADPARVFDLFPRYAERR